MISQPVMRRMLAYDLQARSQGGLDRKTKAHIARLKKQVTSNARDSTCKSAQDARPKHRLKPGGRLLREWNGTTHVVEVTQSGFEWQAKPYKSLSAIARAITGAHWSGPRFFGLTRGRNA